MPNNILLGLDSWLEKKISYPGYSKKQVYVHKTIWKNNAFAFLHALIFLVVLKLFGPEATLIIHYLYAMLTIFTLMLILFLVFPRLFIPVGFVMSIIQHLVTFYYILQLGGIPTSAGTNPRRTCQCPCFRNKTKDMVFTYIVRSVHCSGGSSGCTETLVACSRLYDTGIEFDRIYGQYYIFIRSGARNRALLHQAAAEV